jgi:hypothetical protein
MCKLKSYDKMDRKFGISVLFYLPSVFFIREVLKFELKSQSLKKLIFKKFLKKYFFTIDLTFSIIVISAQILATVRYGTVLVINSDPLLLNGVFR